MRQGSDICKMVLTKSDETIEVRSDFPKLEVYPFITQTKMLNYERSIYFR